jgi:hypothetical protein
MIMGQGLAGRGLITDGTVRPGPARDPITACSWIRLFSVIAMITVIMANIIEVISVIMMISPIDPQG